MSKQPIVEKVKVQLVKEDCPLTIVIPIRGPYWSKLLINCLKSIEIQTLEKSETIISDHGSSNESFKELMEAVSPFHCNVLRYPTKDVWSLSIARNIGIRRACGSHVVTLDADVILEPRVLETILDLLGKNSNSLIVSTMRNLNNPDDINLDNMKLPEDYNKIEEQSRPPRPGIGGLMLATRSWWHKVRGFDERMKGWGAEDDDLRKRAKRSGKTVIYLQNLNLPQTKVFHQWHPRALLVKSKQLTSKDYHAFARANKRIFRGSGTIIRNDASWGVY